MSFPLYWLISWGKRSGKLGSVGELSLEILAWAIVALHPRGFPGGLLPALGEQFQDVRRERCGFSSGKGCLQLLCQVLRRRLTKNGNVPDLLEEKPIR